MAKKKLSLKPVQRGFATTSVASKKAVEQAKAEAEAKLEAEQSAQQASASGTTTGAQTPVDGAGGPKAAADNTSIAPEPASWDDDVALKEVALQGLMVRLQDRGEKEVNRIIKSIEFEKRMAAPFPELRIHESIRDEALAMALEEEGTASNEADPSYRKPLVEGNAASDNDKALLRLFITYQVLKRLGFSEARVLECIDQGLGEGDGWEEALDWMWFHLSEDECLSRGDYAPSEAPAWTEPAPLGDSVPLTENLPVPDETRSRAPLEQANNSREPLAPAGPLFQSYDASSETSESEDELDLDKTNDDWAALMLQLDNLKLAAGGSKAKGKKPKGPAVVLETPEMRALQGQISKLEKEYMFNRKDADVVLKALKAKRDAEALEARLRGRDPPRAETAPPADPATAKAVDLMDTNDEDEGGLFGTLLDEPVASEETSATSTASTIEIRSMPIPKQFSFAGNLPKPTLRASLEKAFKTAAMTYARLSGGSRAARAGLEISLPGNKRKVWKMEDIACENMTEADNYVSTLALHELSNEGYIQPPIWRSFPAPYKYLWEDLEAAAKTRDDKVKLEVWKTVQSLFERKAAVKGKATDGPAATADPVSEQTDVQAPRATKSTIDERLQRDFERRQASPAFQNMLQYRNNLPIASFRQAILDTLESSQVMVVSGETGCGKSTQLPSFILEDQLSKGKPCKIFVTEPRRISAISLAERVSRELGDAAGAMGSNSSLVGYSIRLEAKVSPSTRLAFVTNGIALRMLESGTAGRGGTAFDEVTHIVVDEVHERSIESDFLLLVLKSLMQQRPDLKVVLMSATLDAEKISAFFGGCPFLSVPGRTFPVQVNYLEDAVQLARWHIDESSRYAIRARNKKLGGKQLEWAEENAREEGDSDSDVESAQDPTKLSASRYSPQTVSTVNLLDSRQTPYDLIVRLLERICFENAELVRFSAAILVFMPGLAEIRQLNDMLQSHQAFGAGDFVVYPLHSTISSEGQSAVFDIPAPGIRKIVISTNIAETGVTIPDITCVIDSGKHREMRYDEKRQISRLVETYIARSNAKQRRGRAGRVQEGLAFHLFTKARHDTQLAEHPIPEMLRLSLQDLALRIKILKVKLGSTIEEVLLKALDPPSPINIQRAIASLIEVRALTANEEITPTGRLLSKLPMDVHLGKFLLVAAQMKCLDPALTIAATLNSKSPFIAPFGHETQAKAAKRSFAIGNSDFFTLANVFASWRRASDNPAFIRQFCRKNYLSHQNLQQIEELRQQLLGYLIDSGLVTVSAAQRKEISNARYSRGTRTRFVQIPSEANVHAENLHVLGAAVAAGLYPKILIFDSSGGLRTITNQQPVSTHPSSVNSKVRQAEIGTSYLVYFTIMQSRKLYAWETGPVDDRALALLCGDIADFKPFAGSLHLDRRIRYTVQPKTAIAIKILRDRFAQAMSLSFRGKSWTESQKRWFELGLKALTIGIWDDLTPVVSIL